MTTLNKITLILWILTVADVLYIRHVLPETLDATEKFMFYHYDVTPKKFGYHGLIFLTLAVLTGIFTLITVITW